MRNPLNKRISREFRQDLGKYLVIFCFLILLISLVSGFLVAMNSCTIAYYKGVREYKLEDGHLAFDKAPPEYILDELSKKAGITIYPLPYVNTTTDKGKKIRVYPERDKVDLPCVMEGELPKAKNEIAIDRLFAENNGYIPGSTMTVGGEELKVTGTVALPDYSVLFENNSDSMFNASNFSIAVMTPAGFEGLKKLGVVQNFAWTYDAGRSTAEANGSAAPAGHAATQANGSAEPSDGAAAQDHAATQANGSQPYDRFDDQQNQARSTAVTDALEDILTDYNDPIADEAISAGKLILLDKVLTHIQDQLERFHRDLSMYDTPESRAELLDQIKQGLKNDGIDLSQKLGAGEKHVDLTIDDLQKALDRTPEDVARAQDIVDTVEDRFLKLTDYVPAYKNQAINFAIDDIGGDTTIFLAFNYLVIIVIAFVFAVTIANTIYAEAGVIGTLRASGYTKMELVRHYMTLPLIVTVIAGIIGNILGYTLLKKTMADLYYHSYSLGAYKTVWNAQAFIQTTIIPLVLMFIIDLVVLMRKLSLSPIRFLRHDLTKKGRKRALRLSKNLSFMQRFRLRILFQNLPNYLTLFVGIFLGGNIIIFSLMFMPMIQEYKQLILDTRLSEHQYILKDADRVAVPSEAESFLLTSLKTDTPGYIEDEVTVYGLDPHTRFIRTTLPEGSAVISSSYAEKYGLKIGDKIELKDPYAAQTYELTVTGIQLYYGSLAIFMDWTDFRNRFNGRTDYAKGLLSNVALHLDKDQIAKEITVKDLTMMSAQLVDSIGGFMKVMKYFGVLMFLLLMFLLSKQIIEKNTGSISMSKILGFTDREIGRLYITATSIVVAASLVITCPLAHMVLKGIFTRFIYTKMTGFMPIIVDPSCYIDTILIGLGCYAVVAAMQMRKIRKVSKATILKSVDMLT